MAENEVIIVTGHEQWLAWATARLQEFGLPLGLLPLADVIEVGFERATGRMRIVQRKKVEHSFNSINKLVSYDTEIRGCVEMQKIKELEGVKAKAMGLEIWHPVSEINVDQAAGKINCKSGDGITKAFSVEAFAAGQ